MLCSSTSVFFWNDHKIVTADGHSSKQNSILTLSQTIGMPQNDFIDFKITFRFEFIQIKANIAQDDLQNSTETVNAALSSLPQSLFPLKHGGDLVSQIIT